MFGLYVRRVSLVLMVLYLATILLGVGSAFAKDITLTSADSTEAAKIFDDPDLSDKLTVVLKEGVTGVDDLQIVKNGSNGIVFNEAAFNNATEESRRKALRAWVDALQNSTVSPQGQQTIIDGMADTSSEVSRMLVPMVMESTSADVYNAMKVIAPFLPIVRLILGIGAIVIFLLLSLSTIVDLCFIGLPIAREFMQSKGDDSKGGKVPFVSSDAVSVVNEVEASLDSSGGYKNAYFIYIKRRAWTYVILSFCVVYLVLGELSGFISWLISLASGIA